MANHAGPGLKRLPKGPSAPFGNLYILKTTIKSEIM